jgi:hypothetical protein
MLGIVGKRQDANLRVVAERIEQEGDREDEKEERVGNHKQLENWTQAKPRPQDTPSIPWSLDWDQCHYDEWIGACKGGPIAISNFDVSGPVTEVVLLGNLAIRSGQELTWDAGSMRTDSHQANRWVRNSYRQGWDVDL